jgi:hypothetical protein
MSLVILRVIIIGGFLLLIAIGISVLRIHFLKKNQKVKKEPEDFEAKKVIVEKN